MRLLALLLTLAAPLPGRAQPAARAAEAPPTAAAPATAPVPAPAPATSPSAAVTAKLAEGDRLAQAGDPRNALFAYLDAVYAQPAYLASRVKAGRAYLAMRYPARAIEQAELVLAGEPENAEAKKLLEEARAAEARIGPSPQAPASVAGAAGAGAAAVSPGAVAEPAKTAAAPRPAPRVYKLTPEPAAPSLAAPSAAAPVVAAAAPAPVEKPAVTESGAQHYRTALGMLQNREWAKAIGELTAALEADPKLAVAWSARGSAQFGLGKYPEAAGDYRQAIALDGKLGTPVYGLAECYRQMGERAKAAETYQKYADSKAPDVRDDLRALAAKRAQELK